MASSWASFGSSKNMSTSNRCGGYDNEFSDPLPEECPCQVCTLVQREPYQVGCCGKIFCKSCLDKLVANNSSCPNCRSNFIKKKKFFHDINTERKIKHMKVYCENKKNGCKWIGCLKDLNETHIPKCPNQMVKCTNTRNYKGNLKAWFGTCTLIHNVCGAEVQRLQLQQHMTQECQWREVKCKHCNMSNTHHFIMGQHIEDCPDIIVCCTNKDCKVIMKRKLLADHQRNCPKAIVPCEYSSIGCKEKTTRDKMQTHNQERMEEHLNKAVKTLEHVMKRLEVLEARSCNDRHGRYDDYNEHDDDYDERDDDYDDDYNERDHYYDDDDRDY